jgi:hypothetical protein
MTATEHVAPTTGFGHPFPFVAEVSGPVYGGVVATAVEYGHTPLGALMRAHSTLRGRLVVRPRRTGFYVGDWEFRTPDAGSPFPVGFAA